MLTLFTACLIVTALLIRNREPNKIDTATSDGAVRLAVVIASPSEFM
jgi:hypothetical protein